MIEYCYKVVYLHDHRCDACLKIIKDCCTKTCSGIRDELCEDCKEEYKRYLEKLNK